jgi:DNA-binding PadR family transcriptional regulator
MALGNQNFDLSTLEQKVMLVIVGLNPKAYGISIQDRLKEDTGKEYSFGSIYAALERLEEKGFVKSRLGEATAERGGKRKQYYTVTGEGHVALRKAQDVWDVLRAGAGWKEALA